MDFANRTVMITGAAGNLGRAVANAFSQRGANLALVDRQRDGLEHAFGGENPQRLLIPANLLDAAEIADAVKMAKARFEKIDVLCNIAGGFRMGFQVHETTDQDFDFLLGINARSLLHTVRAVVPGMIDAGYGKIVNVGAISALKGMAGMGAYCASKDIVIRLTETMAAELRDQNISVNCVLPSIIDTPENRNAMPGADTKAWVAPEAIAEVMVFLASDAGRAIRGAAIPVTG